MLQSLILTPAELLLMFLWPVIGAVLAGALILLLTALKSKLPLSRERQA